VRITPLFGAGTVGKSSVVTTQRRLNCYFEVRKDQDKTKIACYGTPGLVSSFTTSTPLGLPLRGFQGTQDSLYIVAYNQFQSINSSGTALVTGAIGTISGQVEMSYSGTQVVLVDGNNAYLFTPATSTFAAIAGFTATGAKTTTFVSGFFVAEQPGTQKFWVSNVYDGSTWNALAFAQAASNSDNIVAVDNLAGTLILFLQKGTEFWQNVGTAPMPFSPVLSATNEFGLAAIFSRKHVDESIIFLAQNRQGQVQFVKLRGFQTLVISDPDIEYIINQFSSVSDAVAMSYGQDQHSFYQVTFPTANRSFLYDCSTGLWSEVQTGSAVIPTRHWGNLSTYYAGRTLVSDYATNRIYTLSPVAYTDNGQVIRRQVITRHILSNFNRIRVSLLYLDMETGVSLQSGQGSNAQVMMEYSKDNGRTWSGERWVSLGLVGNYIARVLWRRFGSTRDATWRITMTDPVKFVITEGAIKISERAQ
jgi:hypothetical protein